MKRILFILLLLPCLQAAAQVPKLYSDNGSTAVIFLDFDGHTVQSVVWNNGNTIVCAPSTGHFNNTQITEIFNRVAEDFRLFRINVTTDSVKYISAPATQRIRMILTPTIWYPGVGGIAYMNSFTWGDNTPGFVFIDPNATTKFAAEAASHESGHSLGLAHQAIYDDNCNMTAGYNPGTGNGEIGWAPIMGFSVDRHFSTWHRGKNSIDCSVEQKDIDVIASKIIGGGMRADDVPNVYSSAAALTVSGNNISATGFINDSADVDVFRISFAQQSKLVLKALPPMVNGAQSYGNVDIMLRLLNAGGVTVATYNYSDSLRAGIDTTLAAGTWYVSVDGINNMNVSIDYGSTGTYFLNGTLTATSALPIYRLDLRGTVNNGQHVLAWQLEADEPIRTTEIQYSVNGTDFTALQKVDYRNGGYAWKPFTGNTIYYRIRAWLRDGSYKTSNVIALQNGRDNAGVQLLNNNTADVLLVGSRDNYQFEIYDMTGRVTARGRLTAGLNRIPVSGSRQGVYLLKAFNESASQTERFLKQ